MRLLILALFLFNATFALAARELSTQSFQIHIRPQLVNIQEDIKQILLTFPGYPADIFIAQNLTDQLMASTMKAHSLCPGELKKACLLPIQDAIKIMREMERVWLTQESKTSFPANASIALLNGKKRWNQIIMATRRLRSILETESLAIEADRNSKRLTIWDWRRRVDEIDGWQTLAVIDFIPGKLQEDFRQAWMNFFRPLQKHCVLSNNKTYFSKNLDSLNYYWNLLNMRLTKRLKRTPEGMSGPLNAIQDRWNQTLRVAFGT
jgi:hypothetical protein